jgi:hypothetical protein
MTFDGTQRPTGYCLRREAATCTRPYGEVPINAVSLSGAAIEPYCGFNQEAVTCEAILDLVNGTTCTVKEDCGDGQGGRCEKVGTNNNRCSYSCGVSNDCPVGKACSDQTPWCH